MIQTFTVRPQTDLKEIEPKEQRIMISNENFEYTVAYCGPYTYSWETHVDNDIHVADKSKGFWHNFHIGNGCSLGSDLRCVFGRNHNIKKVSSGGMETHFDYSGIPRGQLKSKSNFHRKGSIVIQNDVWIGDNVTIMSGVIVRNGAVVAQNAHVVKDVPAYAVVGGNPARVIGWRFPKQIIEKLQMIQWWYWNHWKLVENYNYFNEDIEGFCDRFYEDAQKEFQKLSELRKVTDDAYFTFVDYYENYHSFVNIVTEFVDTFSSDESKRLILFIQTDCNVPPIDSQLLQSMQTFCERVEKDPVICAHVEIVMGDKKRAEEVFLTTSHYLITRTFNTVYFTCLADRFNIEILSGVDQKLQFFKEYNIVKSE